MTHSTNQSTKTNQNLKKQKNMKQFRIFEDGELIWEGCAHDPDHAIDKCFTDETPGAFCKYTIQGFQKIKISKTMKTIGWYTYMREERINLMN